MKKIFGSHAPSDPLGTGAKYARLGSDFGKNVKIDTFGQVISDKLNCLGVIICLVAAKKNFVT